LNAVAIGLLDDKRQVLDAGEKHIGLGSIVVDDV
jgi:hypothetical protein